MRERVLVTGAGGFVCRYVVEALAVTGMRVIAVDQSFDSDLAQRWKSLPIELLSNDCRSLPRVPVDYVVHGAALTAGPEEANQSPIENYRANLDPALDVLQWAAAAGAKRTIVVSSSAVFRGSPESVYTEETLPVATGTYMAAKRAIELVAQTLRTDYGQDVVSIRLGSVYGPTEIARETRPRVSRVMRLLHDAMSQRVLRVPSDGDRMDWTYAPDIGQALVALLGAPSLNHDLYHVTSGEALTDLEIARAVAAVLPGADVELLDPQVPPYRGAMTGTRLAHDTGFNAWTSFRDGLASVVMWLQQESERVP
ncbi:MAG: NAD(P)-dependent oxidoreductase [Chloroflexi bacterium]|nr:NAD(P)-dependent oxidoreductase [Chloroflexota bacterium]